MHEIGFNRMFNYHGSGIPPLPGGTMKLAKGGEILRDILDSWTIGCWFDKSKSRSYVVIDSYCFFLSRSALQEIINKLRVIRETWGGANMKVVVPTPVYEGISTVVENNEMAPEVIEIIQELWNFDSSEKAATYLRGLISNQEYISQWRKFMSSFSPLRGSDAINQNKHIHDEFKKLNKEFKEKLQGSVAQEKAEELSIITKSRFSMLISLGEKPVELINRTEQKIVEVHSEYKEIVETHSNMGVMLRVIILVKSHVLLDHLRDKAWISTDDNSHNAIRHNTPLLLVLKGG